MCSWSREGSRPLSSMLIAWGTFPSLQTSDWGLLLWSEPPGVSTEMGYGHFTYSNWYNINTLYHEIYSSRYVSKLWLNWFFISCLNISNRINMNLVLLYSIDRVLKLFPLKDRSDNFKKYLRVMLLVDMNQGGYLLALSAWIRDGGLWCNFFLYVLLSVVVVSYHSFQNLGEKQDTEPEVVGGIQLISVWT